MSIVEREGQPLQNRDYRQHLNRNWDNINGFEKTVNRQIEQALSNPPAGTADELAQLRIDTQGNEYPLAKPRIDSIERDASYASQEVVKKADKDYINNYLSQISYSPETVASLDELKSKYPNGKPGLFITADNGHKYIWSNNAWTDAGIYQSVGVADGSLSADKLKQSALSSYSLIVGGDLPNYDQTTKTFTFGNSDKTPVIAWGDIHRYSIPQGTVVLNEPETSYTATRLMFNTSSKTFRFIAWDENYSSDEISIMTVRAFWGNDYGIPLISANFPVLVNGEFGTTEDRWCRVIPSPNFKPDYNDFTHVFDFNSKKFTDFTGSYEPSVVVLIKNNKTFIMDTNVVLENTVASGNKSSYARLIFSTLTNSFKFQTVDLKLKYHEYTVAIIRDNTISSSSYSNTIVTSLSEITVNGKSNTENEEDTNANVIAINHRGASSYAPEESFAAYKLSRQLGFKHIEGDIQFTSDGIPIMIHDETINRTAVNADGTKLTSDVKVVEKTLEQLNAYDFGTVNGKYNEKFKGTKLLTLEELIKFAKRSNMQLHLELKIDMTDAQIDKIVKMIWDFGMQNHVFWQSFVPSRFGRLVELIPKATLAFLFDKSTTAEQNIAVMKPYMNSSNEVIASVQAGSDRSKFYLYSKENIKVFVWTYYTDGAVVDWGTNTAVSGIMTQGDIQQAYILSRQ